MTKQSDRAALTGRVHIVILDAMLELEEARRAHKAVCDEIDAIRSKRPGCSWDPTDPDQARDLRRKSEAGGVVEMRERALLAAIRGAGLAQPTHAEAKQALVEWHRREIERAQKSP